MCTTNAPGVRGDQKRAFDPGATDTGHWVLSLGLLKELLSHCSGHELLFSLFTYHHLSYPRSASENIFPVFFLYVFFIYRARLPFQGGDAFSSSENIRQTSFPESYFPVEFLFPSNYSALLAHWDSAIPQGCGICRCLKTGSSVECVRSQKL